MRFREKWESSFTCHMGRAMIKKLIHSSPSERFWEASFIYSFIQKASLKTAEPFRKLYTRYSKTFSSSLLMRPLLFLSQHTGDLAFLFLLAAFLLPHAYWNDRYSSMIAIFLLCLSLLKTVAGHRDKIQPKVFDLFLFTFLLSVIIARIFSVFPEQSTRVFSYYLTCFVFYYVLVSTTQTKQQLESHIRLFLTGATISGFYGLIQSIEGIPVIPFQIDTRLNEGMPGRVFSTFENSNNFAQVLVMTIPFYIATIFNTEKRSKKIAYSILMLPSFISLFLSLSRSGWIGFAVAACCFILLTRPSLIPLLGVAGLLIVPFLPDFVVRRLSTITNPQDSSWETRLNILKTMEPVVKDFWYTGIGLGSDAVKRIVRNYPIYTTTLPPHSHNLYLQIWLETGLVGILSFIGFILHVIKKSVVTLFSKDIDPALGYYIRAGISGLAGILVIACIEYVWFYPRVMLIFWTLISLLISSVHLACRSKVEKHS